jgi:hypothetical protein
VDWIGKASLPAAFIIPDGMGDRVVVSDGSVVTMSADPPKVVVFCLGGALACAPTSS